MLVYAVVYNSSIEKLCSSLKEAEIYAKELMASRLNNKEASKHLQAIPITAKHPSYNENIVDITIVKYQGTSKIPISFIALKY